MFCQPLDDPALAILDDVLENFDNSDKEEFITVDVDEIDTASDPNTDYEDEENEPPSALDKVQPILAEVMDAETLMKQLVERHADAMSPSSFMVASLRSDSVNLMHVRRLIEVYKADIDVRDARKNTPLHWACWHNHHDIVEYLLEQGAHPDLKNQKAETPLMWCCGANGVRSAKHLIEYNANLDFRDGRGSNLVTLAAERGHPEIIDFFVLFHDQNIEHKNNSGQNALHMAATGDFPITMHALLVRGLSPFEEDRFGNLPIHIAARHGNVKAASTLISCHDCITQDPVDMLRMKNKDGLTAEQVARKSGNRKCARLLANRLARAESPFFLWFDQKTNNRFAMRGMWQWAISNQFLFYGTHTYSFIMSVILATYFYDSFFLNGIGMIFYNMITVVMMILLVNSQPGFLRRPSEINMKRGRKRKKKQQKYERLDPGSPNVGTQESLSLVAAEQRMDFLEEEYRKKLAEGDLGRLCVTCQILKPDRAKHCVEYNMCIDKFDHFCPYILNAVGRENHARFFIMIIVEIIALVWFITVSIVFLIFHKDAKHMCGAFYPIMIMAFLALIFLVIMLLTQGFMITVNETTNEKQNWMRYDYMVNPETKKFFNPYDYGGKENWKRFFFENNEDPPKKKTWETMRKTSMEMVRMNPFIKQMVEQQYDNPMGPKFEGLERKVAWTAMNNLANTEQSDGGAMPGRTCITCENH